MQSTELLKDIAKQYQVLATNWLEDLACQPSSTLYKSWSACLQTQYQPNQRFVLCNFRPVDTLVMQHVATTITKLDISPCFVLLVTNQHATVDWFRKQDSAIEIQSVNFTVPHFVPIRAVQPLFNNDNFACAHAWVGLHVWPSGAVGPCCEYHDTVPDMNIKSNSLKEIMLSDHMQQLRSQFRQGQWPAGCQTCRDIESAGGESKKQLTQYKLQNLYHDIDWESDHVKPGFVGGHLGNLCNLRCRICSPIFSSSIAVEELNNISTEVKQHPTYQLLANNRWSGNSEQFWQQLRENATTLCNFEFLGGEPLLLKENLEFMQWLIDCGHSHRAIFEFVTNGTQYPDIFDQADKFARLTVTISIDNLGPRFELERDGASWDLVCDNVKKFVACRQRTQNLRIGVCITVNIQNVLYLPELIQWIRSQDIDHYFFNILHDPQFLSVDQLTPDAQRLVLDRLSGCDLADEDRKRLAFVIETVSRATTSDGQDFRNHMRRLDQQRQQNFVLTHQEIAQAMGFVLQSQDD